MAVDVDDIHGFDAEYIKTLENLSNSDISPTNKKLITNFANGCRHDGLKKSTILGYVQNAMLTLSRMAEMGWEGELDKIEYDDYSEFLIYLEDVHEVKASTVRNYKKFIKKYYGWRYDGEPPRWVQRLKLGQIQTTVQPSDLITSDELEKLLKVCKHPRDKAFIAVLADSGMRVGALGSCRIKNVEFNQYGGMVYISRSSRSRKTAPPKGIPITWSTGYLNAWLGVHPLSEDPEAALWVTLDKNQNPLSYKVIRTTLQRIGEKAGVTKRVNPHVFRHTAITDWILDGFNDQKIKHRAGLAKGSTRILEVYSNFADKEINDGIYEQYGLKTEDKRTITLKNCPRCNNILKPDDKFCSQCSLVLDQKTALAMDSTKNDIMATSMDMATGDDYDGEKAIFEKLWREMRANKEK